MVQYSIPENETITPYKVPSKRRFRGRGKPKPKTKNVRGQNVPKAIAKRKPGRPLPPGLAKKVAGVKSAKSFAPGQIKKRPVNRARELPHRKPARDIVGPAPAAPTPRGAGPSTNTRPRGQIAPTPHTKPSARVRGSFQAIAMGATAKKLLATRKPGGAGPAAPVKPPMPRGAGPSGNKPAQPPAWGARRQGKNPGAPGFAAKAIEKAPEIFARKRPGIPEKPTRSRSVKRARYTLQG